MASRRVQRKTERTPVGARGAQAGTGAPGAEPGGEGGGCGHVTGARPRSGVLSRVDESRQELCDRAKGTKAALMLKAPFSWWNPQENQRESGIW